MNILSIKSRTKFIDLFGIILIVVIGIRGQVYVFKPTSALHSDIPLLSTQDLPGSQLDVRLRVPREWKPGKHEYFMKMKIVTNEPYINEVKVMVSQTALWHADSTRSIDEWKSRKRDFGNMKPVTITPLDIDRPESVLYCPSGIDDSSKNRYEQSCYYLAYWEHWYTEVNIYSRGEEHLSYLEVKKIIDQVEQSLLSAPARP
jgi:hypothetical protein